MQNLRLKTKTPIRGR